MRVRRCVALPFILILCLMLGSFSASAADSRLGAVVDGSLLTDGTEAVGEAVLLARGTYLSSGTGTVSLAGTHQVRISGSTSAYRTVDEINVSVHLQRLVGNSWVNVTSLGPVRKYNTYKVSTSGTYTVTGGYYYRVRGSHMVSKNGTVESTGSYSDGIWVD